MALSFPLSAAAFFQTLQIASGRVHLPGLIEVSQTAGGEVFTADLGARLWAGQATLAPRNHAALAVFEAKLALMQQPGASFFAYDPRRVGPAYDPAGTILGASSPVIASLNGNARELTISGLPAAYVLTPGDYLAWAYGSSPTRYAMHQIVTGATASGGGVTGSIEVTPYIRAGAAVSAAVTLIRPAFKSVIVPGSVTPSDGGQVLSRGLSFAFQQTLR